MKENKDKSVELTDNELLFCQLYVFGGMEYAGKHVKCYEEVFGSGGNVHLESRKLLSKLPIQSTINELAEQLKSETETVAVKLQIAETLKAVMEETATSTFSDKFGISLSPAPLRAVSVNAAKALMELYPVKHGKDKDAKSDGFGAGITFNVIVPDNDNQKKNEK